MKTTPRSILFTIAAALLISACATVPYTNRKQFNLVSSEEEASLGLQAFQEVKTKSPLSKDAAVNAQIQRIGQRIAAAANKPDFKWEFIVIDEPKTVNAFCLPGGKVAFYTGILPICKDDDGIAVVMAHEVAHALARHGAERMSEGMAVGLVEQAAVAGGLIKSQAALSMVENAYGIGRALPHSRKQESESDHIGLILMAKAGYDPRTAVGFWQRMAAASKGAPPEFLSSHPSDETRIRQIQELLPEALTYYKP